MFAVVLTMLKKAEMFHGTVDIESRVFRHGVLSCASRCCDNVEENAKQRRLSMVETKVYWWRNNMCFLPVGHRTNSSGLQAVLIEGRADPPAWPVDFI